MTATQARVANVPSQTEANKRVLQRYLDEIFNDRNYAAIDELIHPDFHCDKSRIESNAMLDPLEIEVPLCYRAIASRPSRAPTGL